MSKIGLTCMHQIQVRRSDKVKVIQRKSTEITKVPYSSIHSTTMLMSLSNLVVGAI